MKGLSVAFTIIFGLVLAGVVFLVAFGIAHVVVKICRLFFPDFARQSKIVDYAIGSGEEFAIGPICDCTKIIFRVAYKEVSSNAEFKKDRSDGRVLAIDFLIQEKLKKQRERQKRIEELLHSPVSESGTEWGLESLKHQVAQQMLQEKIAGRSEPIDLWSVCKKERGVNQYLCTPVMPTRDGLKTAWACLPDRALKTSAEAAFRWLSVLPENCFVLPANSAARRKIRNEALKLRGQHVTA